MIHYAAMHGQILLSIHWQLVQAEAFTQAAGCFNVEMSFWCQ